jgi:hypothetical protein
MAQASVSARLKVCKRGYNWSELSFPASAVRSVDLEETSVQHAEICGRGFRHFAENTRKWGAQIFAHLRETRLDADAQ